MGSIILAKSPPLKPGMAGELKECKQKSRLVSFTEDLHQIVYFKHHSKKDIMNSPERYIDHKPVGSGDNEVDIRQLGNTKQSQTCNIITRSMSSHL